MTIVYYEDNGRIVQTDNGQLPAHLPPGRLAKDQGLDPTRYYMPEGINAPRPVLFDGVVAFRTASDVPVRIHDDLPAMKIIVEGVTSWSGEHPAGPLDFEATLPGVYRIFVEAFPFQMAVVVVEVV